VRNDLASQRLGSAVRRLLITDGWKAAVRPTIDYGAAVAQLESAPASLGVCAVQVPPVATGTDVLGLSDCPDLRGGTAIADLTGACRWGITVGMAMHCGERMDFDLVTFAMFMQIVIIALTR
jgi:hypothetical protein